MEDFRLLIVQTGGTIDKDYPKRKGGYSFELCDSGALSVLRKVQPSFPFRLVTPCLEDSQDLTNQHRFIYSTGPRDLTFYLKDTHSRNTPRPHVTFQAARCSSRHLILRACQEAAAERHILVTHGTDTILPTATYLATHLHPHPVIVLTGAFLPERFKDSDADFNVGVAVGAMQGGLPPGVYVALGGRVWSWDRVTRLESGQFVSVQ
ncbi:uncharacterized protein LOC143281358 [Babylonia areolata]|uniref:uncharacterized protein LOC143281358 n=1 Tax=Babylonia areolata TaxID=304850 RepID=UPI003FD44F7A